MPNEPQEYTVKSWQAWMNDDGLVRDNHGNYKGSVTFDEFNSEPVDATFKTEPKVGDKKYGLVAEYKTKAGKTRIGFTRKDRPDANNNSYGISKGNSSQPKNEDGIYRCNALNNATSWSNGVVTPEEVLEAAEKFYAWLKNEQPKATGYDQAKAQADKLRVQETFSNGEPLPAYSPSSEDLGYDDANKWEP